MLFIWSLVFFLFILVLMVAVFRRDQAVIVYDDYDDEIETTVTTTVTTNQIATVGTIYAFQKLPDATWYVIDPVDNQETSVNANDDYYRDAGGRVWSLM